jgi:RNA polymerase sigma factor (sigma-70 family)
MNTLTPPASKDIAELYRALSGRLEQLVRRDVRAPDAVIEDACQFAWSRFVYHSDRVHHEAAFSWLAKTAVREAFKLLRRADRCVSLDALVEHSGDRSLRSRAPEPDQLVASHEKLSLIRALPERQQRLLWLHSFGLSYVEMARYAACTPRTVERQLLRAKRRLREASLE